MLTGPINPVETMRWAVSNGLAIPPAPALHERRPPKGKSGKHQRNPHRKIGVPVCGVCGKPAEWCGERLGWKVVCEGCELP